MKITLAQTNPAPGDIVGNSLKIRDAYLAADARGVDLVVAPAHAILGCPPGEMEKQPDVLHAAEAAKAALASAAKGRRALLIADETHTRSVAVRGATLLVSPTAAPFRPNALRERVRTAAARAAKSGIPLIQVNAAGGRDEAVFDGGSFILNEKGERIAQASQWREAVLDCDLSQSGGAIPDSAFPDPLEELWQALVLGLGDYARKSGFSDVVLGLSGGMDSALAAAVAGDALGADRVHCVRLPSRHTSDLSNRAAEDMCALWGFPLDAAPIGGVVEAAAATLAPIAGGGADGGLKKLTRENMQARARGYLLMTLSNDRGWLLLSTGNKSEIAVGYSTLYGDMCGGFNPLKDVFKTTVYALAAWRNANRPANLKGPEGMVIPADIIDRPPSAELSPGQLDTDSLPPYPVLDAILAEMLEKGTPLPAIAAKGFDPALVSRVQGMVRRAEYKRRQAAPGPVFIGMPCMPMTNRFDPSQTDALS